VFRSSRNFAAKASRVSDAFFKTETWSGLSYRGLQ
jgi:hypothetical protein